MKKYYGRRASHSEVHVSVEEDTASTPLDPRHDIWNHSPNGFNWGYCGSGPAQLALALLADATDDAYVTVLWYQEFKRKVVAKLPHHAWVMDREFILDWIIKQCISLLMQQEVISMDDGEVNGL